MTTPPKETALEQRAAEGAKMYSPSAARNRDNIRDVFVQTMPREGEILEVGGGTGEHAVHLAAALPQVRWFTGDPDETARASIAAWIADSKLDNLHGPHAIDVAADDWDASLAAAYDGVVSINMIHIAPFIAAEGLFTGAGKLLRPGGKLFLYGPFSRIGVHTAPSNDAFECSLKSRNPDWGVRDLENDIVPLARKNFLTLDQAVEMPANNFSVIFRKN